ncbi:MAG: ornithine carbamoyltransferase [Chitinispirillaceae bacterium]
MSRGKKDLITLLDFDPKEIINILNTAAELKKNRLMADEPKPMKGRTGVLIFEKPSLRTRITFETAVYELGGNALNLASNMVQMGKRESVEDVARNLQRWIHLIVARTYSNDTLVQLAKHSCIPVINALSDKYHPCQALAFALTLKERHPQNKKPHVVFLGDGNNVCASIMILCAKLGYDFSLVCPPGYELAESLVSQCSQIGTLTGSSIRVTHKPADVVSEASVIYTDVWASMGQEDEAEKRASVFAEFQLNQTLLSAAPSDVLVSHCLPAHRGEEITSDVLDSKHSVAFDEAENRLHVQKAVIVHLFS